MHEKFPKQSKALASFFNFIQHSDFATAYTTLKNKTFKEWLDSYFNDKKLKCILSSCLINVGFPSYMASALNIFYQFKEFIFDGGYYPKDGFQKFSDILANKFTELSGNIIFGKKVKKINIDNKKVNGVTVEDNATIFSNIVVSNCDIFQTFSQLIKPNYIPIQLSKIHKSLAVSPSAFIVYLALSKNTEKNTDIPNAWYFEHYDIDKVFKQINRDCASDINDIILCARSHNVDKNLELGSNKEVMSLISLAPYTSCNYWQENRGRIADSMIKKAESVFGQLFNKISVKETATPFTLERYTKNFHGSCFGLGSIVNQIDRSIMPQRSLFVGNLYMTGHWSTGGAGQGGISFSAASGRNVAKLIVLDRGAKRNKRVFEGRT